MKKYLFFALAALTLAGCEKPQTEDTENGKKNEPDPVKVESVTVTPEAITLQIGQKQTLEVNVLPENADKKDVTWTSSAPTIASVDPATGEVEALAEGEATITATATDDSGEKGSCVVTVPTPVIPGVVAITGEGFDITQEQTADPNGTVVVNFEAEKGIDQLLMLITTTHDGLRSQLEGMSIANEFDLANPGEEMAAAIEGLKMMGITWPYGEAVKGQTELALDLQTFITPVIWMASDSILEIRFTLVDPDGTSDIQTLKLNIPESEY
jgi:hypothetical protein